MKTSYSIYPWSRKPSLQILVGSTELKALLKLANPAVVTNWRSRYPDFPGERISGRQPRFDAVEVIEWLQHSGPRNTEVRTVVPGEWWKRIVQAFFISAAVDSPRNTLMALLLLDQALRSTDLPQPEAGRMLAELREIEPPRGIGTRSRAASALADAARWAERSDARLRGLLRDPLDLMPEDAGYALDVLDAIEHTSDLTGAARLRSIISLDRDGHPKLQQRRTRTAVAELMVTLAELPPGGSLLDPAAGEGSVLLAAAKLHPGVELLGQELDTATHAIAASRFILEGVAVDFAMPDHDSLFDDQHTGRQVSAVVIDPPFGPSAPSLTRWLELGLGHLAEGGRLVISLPLADVIAVGERRRVDKHLAHSVEQAAQRGALAGMVVLPRHTRKEVGGPVLLCVFTRPDPAKMPARQVPLVVVQSRPRESGLEDVVALTEALQQHGLHGIRTDKRGSFDVRQLYAVEALSDAQRILDEPEQDESRVQLAPPDPPTQIAVRKLIATSETLLAALGSLDKNSGDETVDTILFEALRVKNALSVLRFELGIR